jgi:hypothetical protein
MSEIKRQSPVRFKVSPTKSEVRDNWTVALEYDDEGQGPWLVDLAHKTRWDLQDSQVGEQTPCDLAVPAVPGACTFANDTLVNRMNRTQASIYHLGAEAPGMPDFSGYTDVTESTVVPGPVRPQRIFRRRKADQPGFSGSGQANPFSAAGPLLPRALPDRHPGEMRPTATADSC